MNCAFHAEEVAVAQCADCGRGLCKECSDKYDIAICDACNEKRKIDDKSARKYSLRGYKWAFIASIVLFFAGLCLCLYMGYNETEFSKNGEFGKFLAALISGKLIENDGTPMLPDTIITSLIFFGIPWGWITWKQITRDWIVFKYYDIFSVIVRFAFLPIKIIICGIAGVFCFPVQLIIWIVRSVRE